MRISKASLTMAISFLALCVGAQTQVGKPLILTNHNAVTTRNIAPSLGVSNVTPAIGRQGVTPAMPNPGGPAIGQTQGFTTAIGQQGFGGAIGRQGSGTAIGQQGSGTAIGQQGAGTAIAPPNTPAQPANGIVIGQPEPFVTSPAISPNNAPGPGPGSSTNLPNSSGPQKTIPLPPGGLTNAPIRPVMPSPVLPALPPPIQKR